MTEKHILLLSQNHLVCYRCRAGVVYDEFQFENSPAGLAAFSVYVSENLGAIYTLLVNLPEEGFQTETIPYLRHRDRAAVISRKLTQTFYETPYTAAFSLGYEKTRRKDERLLLAALTEPATLDPWVKVLNEARVIFTGIHSLPFVGATLVSRLKMGDQPCILLTLQEDSLRETLVIGGKAHFSRLIPLANPTGDEIAQRFSSEAIRLHQYLLSQRMVSRHQRLRAIVVTHPSIRKTVEAHCLSNEALEFIVVNSDDCAKRIGLKNSPATHNAVPLLVHLAATSPSRTQFAQEKVRHDFRLWQFRTLLYSVSAAVLIACLVYSGQKMFDAYKLRRETLHISAQAQDAQQRYAEIVSTFPAVPEKSETLRQFVTRYKELERGGATPERFLLMLSSALDKSPGIELESLRWTAVTRFSKTTVNAGNAPQVPANAIAQAQINGFVTLAPNATPRQTMNLFNQFLSELRTDPVVEITVTQKPIDLDSGKPLRSNSGTDSSQVPHHFTLNMVRKGPP